MQWFHDAQLSETMFYRIIGALSVGEYHLFVYDATLSSVYPVHEGATYFKVRDKMIAIVPEMRHV